jgi:heterodisulfide reductase subunit A
MEEDGRVEERMHDLAVLSLGMLPACNPQEFVAVGRDEDGFVTCSQPKTAPALTDQEGVFVAGTASGPKDIVDTIAKAGSAAMEAANYMRLLKPALSEVLPRAMDREEHVHVQRAAG